MMTFRVRLKKTKKPTQSRLRFDLGKLRNPDVAGKFQATIVGKLAPLINLRDLLYCCKVMSGRSVNITTLFLGRLRPPKRLNSTSCTYFR